MPMNGNPAQAQPNVIIIVDPIAQDIYTLIPSQRIAHHLSMGLPESLPQSPPSAVPPPTPFPPPAHPKETSEDLGTQTMEGVLVQGKRRTSTFPVGSVGNDAPIVQVEEVWTSIDLKLTILSKRSDPRVGETVTRVTSLDRSEPDPALFQVPPDYTISSK